jgi:hypothetical protein
MSEETLKERAERYGVRLHPSYSTCTSSAAECHTAVVWPERTGSGRGEANCADRDTAERAAIVAALIVQGSPVPLSLLGETVDDRRSNLTETQAKLVQVFESETGVKLSNVRVMELDTATEPTAPDDLALSRRILTYIKKLSVDSAFDCVRETTNGDESEAREYACVAEQLDACAKHIRKLIEGAP